MDDSQLDSMGSRLSDRMRLLLDEATTAASCEGQAANTDLNLEEVLVCPDAPRRDLILI